MNKKELVAKLAKKAGISQGQALDAVNFIFDAEPGHGIIAVELDAGRKVVIPGFGTFDTKTRAARTALNPATGEPVAVPKKSYVTFKPGKTLRERVAK